MQTMQEPLFSGKTDITDVCETDFCFGVFFWVRSLFDYFLLTIDLSISCLISYLCLSGMWSWELRWISDDSFTISANDFSSCFFGVYLPRSICPKE